MRGPCGFSASVGKLMEIPVPEHSPKLKERYAKSDIGLFFGSFLQGKG
jgi:hypothetical protein